MRGAPNIDPTAPSIITYSFMRMVVCVCVSEREWPYCSFIHFTCLLIRIACVCEYVCAYVCVCVCERESDPTTPSIITYSFMRIVCVCVWEREGESESDPTAPSIITDLSIHIACACRNVCVCVCVCVRENETLPLLQSLPIYSYV